MDDILENEWNVLRATQYLATTVAISIECKTAWSYVVTVLVVKIYQVSSP